MAKKDATRFSFGVFDRKHISNIRKRLKAIDDLFGTAVTEGARIGETSGFKNSRKPFLFSDYPGVQERIDDLMRSVCQGLRGVIEAGDREEWLLSCEKNDALVDAMVSSTGIPKDVISRWKQPNLEALSAFQHRKEAGMMLSDRVWNITEQFKQELELALDLGLGEGKSAADLSRDVRKYLSEPNKLFRRVRDKHGVLRLSKASRAYHPGQGVYRSSYKNALRLTATETNMAYRRADWERWQTEPWVVGQRIKVAHKGHPVYDICDELQGEYPKDFIWTGWHPFCKCASTPILAPENERMEYLQKMMDGEDVSEFKFSWSVLDVPEKFSSWLKNNESRMNDSKSVPYFLKDNPKYAGVVAPRFGAGSRYSGTKLGRSATKAAYKEYEDALPPTLSAEQKANIDEIAKEIGIDVTPMSFLDADSGRGNIHFGKGTSYEENCQCCVAVHEARLRGLNLTAVAYNADTSSIQWQLGERFEDIWINPRTNKKPVVQKIKGANDDEILQNLEKQMQSSGRYHIGVNFLDGRGHVITAERMKSDRVIYYDAQSGEFLNIREYAALESVELLKVDKLLFDKSMLRAISELLK